MATEEKFTKKLPRVFDAGDPLKNTRQTYWIELTYSVKDSNKLYVIRDGQKIPESHWAKGVGMMNVRVYSALGTQMKRVEVTTASIQDLDEWRLRVSDMNSRERNRSKRTANDAKRRLSDAK